jgi:hypothetical protein
MFLCSKASGSVYTYNSRIFMCSWSCVVLRRLFSPTAILVFVRRLPFWNAGGYRSHFGSRYTKGRCVQRSPFIFFAEVRFPAWVAFVGLPSCPWSFSSVVLPRVGRFQSGGSVPSVCFVRWVAFVAFVELPSCLWSVSSHVSVLIWAVQIPRREVYNILRGEITWDPPPPLTMWHPGNAVG